MAVYANDDLYIGYRVTEKRYRDRCANKDRLHEAQVNRAEGTKKKMLKLIAYLNERLAAATDPGIRKVIEEVLEQAKQGVDDADRTLNELGELRGIAEVELRTGVVMFPAQHTRTQP